MEGLKKLTVLRMWIGGETRTINESFDWDKEFPLKDGRLEMVELTGVKAKIKNLEAMLKVAEETLSLISGPSNFNCEIGEGNQRAAATSALKQINSMKAGE